LEDAGDGPERHGFAASGRAEYADAATGQAEVHVQCEIRKFLFYVN
jgi:hypothetical protein